MRRFYYNAQWLRFACAIYLVIYHSVSAVRASPTTDVSLFGATFGLGFFATSVFFVLSGFLLSHAYAEFRDDGVGLRVERRLFFANRLSAIYPVHLFAMLAYLLLAWGAGKAMLGNFGGLDEFLGRAPWQKIALDPVEFWGNLGLTLVLLQAWNPYFLNLNGATWSLSALLFFYALFPWIMPRLLGARRKGRLLLLVFLVYSLPAIVLYLAQIDGALATGAMHRNPLLRLPEFVSGILLYGLVRERPPERDEGPGRLIAMAVLAMISLVAAGQASVIGSKYVWYLLHNGALLPVAVLIVHLTTRLPDLPGRGLATRLGAASLCIFALHAPIGMAFKLALGGGGGGGGASACPPRSVACAAGLNQLEAIAMLGVYLVVVVAAALLAQSWLVGPLNRALRARLSRSAGPEPVPRGDAAQADALRRPEREST